MRTTEYIPLAIKAAIPEVEPLRGRIQARVRFSDGVTVKTDLDYAQGEGIVWSVVSESELGLMDVDPLGLESTVFVLIQCRVQPEEGADGFGLAEGMADDILTQFARDEALQTLVSRFDDTDDNDEVEAELGIHQHVIVVGLPGSGLSVNT